MVISAPENKRQILRMVIKCADVSNPAREIHLCKEWAYRIAEEYFQQVSDRTPSGVLRVVCPTMFYVIFASFN